MPLERFLEYHWRRRPLVARRAVIDVDLDLEPEDLAGLACIEGVTSRLIVQPAAADHWEMRHGPFDEADFRELPDRNWTLLVQEVDRWMPAAARLMDAFRFVPNWRVDDVMVSYAVDEGGVGPHVDRYDVFLVQLRGKRRWSFGHRPLGQADERLVPDLDLRVLADFVPDESVVLEPGDLLYLPPRVAHDGVALEPGMTASVGFRAPSTEEIVTALLPQLLMNAGDTPLGDDERTHGTEDHGHITPETLERIRAEIRNAVDGSLTDCLWIGRMLTEPQREPPPACRPAPWRDTLRAGGRLRRVAAPLFAWCDVDAQRIALFVGGQDYTLERELLPAARLLCGTAALEARALEPFLTSATFEAVVEDLCCRGFLLTEEAEEGADGDHL